MKTPKAIRAKDRDTIIRALSAGVVPRIGLQHIQVGRAGEVQAMLRDIEVIADGGATVRFIIGDYGAGKTFFLNLVRAIALERRLVTLHADLGPNKRLHASKGQARTLYAETVRNMATRSKAEGGALDNVVELFITAAKDESDKSGRRLDSIIRDRLQALRGLAGGYDFAEVIVAYWRGWETDNDTLKTAALRWLRGEYNNRTEARQDLQVRAIVDDISVYDHWKLLARFVRQAGYGGLLIMLDEMVNLFKLQSAQARTSNYEQILGIIGDTLQQNTEGIGFVFGGTPEFLRDTRRGLFSYPALQSRLVENRFAKDGLVDRSGPVIELESLSSAELYVLLGNVRKVFAGGDPAKHLVPDDAIEAFMAHCEKRLGDAYFRTPRTTIKQFVDLLSVIEQNSTADWRQLLGAITPERDQAPDSDDIVEDDDDLATFTLR